MPDAGSALIGDYSSNDEDSIQGSAATAAEAREAGSQSASGLPQDFFEVRPYHSIYCHCSTQATAGLQVLH